MEGRPKYSPASLLYYYNMLKNPEIQGVHDRMWERQTPPPYNYYDQDQEPPRYGAHIHDGRDMGRLDYGIPQNHELDYLEPDPPRYGGHGRHVYDVDVYGGTYDEIQFGHHHDDGYGVRNMGGHRGQFGLRDTRGSRMDRANEEVIDEMGLPSRDHYSRYEYRDHPDLSPGHIGGLGSRLRRGPEPRPDLFNDGIGLDGMSLLTPDRYPRHDYHENRYQSLGNVGGLGFGLTPGVEQRPDDFNDALGLDVRGVREFEREMRGTWAQRRHSFDNDVEDDATRDGFRSGHHRTNPYRSRYGARPGYHSESYLEDDDLADGFRGRGRGPRPHRSGYPVEDDFELDNEDVRHETMLPRKTLRRQIHHGAAHSDFVVKPHKAQRGATSRGRPKRQFPDISDDDDSEEPPHVSDSEDERTAQSIRRRGRAGIPPIKKITDERPIQPRAQGHRARTTAAHLTTKTLNSTIIDLPRGRHTTPQPPPRPYKRRSRHHTLRPRAHDDTSHHKGRHEPAASPGTSVKAPNQAPMRPQTDLSATSANTPADRPAEAATSIKAAVQESPRGAPTAQRSTHEADKQEQQQLQGDQDDDAGNNHEADALHPAAEGQQSLDRDGLGRVESLDASKADVGADLFSDGSDDGFDTPGSGSEGSDDEGFVQSFIRITL